MGGRNYLQVVGLLMFIVGFPKNIIDMLAATLMLLHIWLSNVSLDTKARSMLHGSKFPMPWPFLKNLNVQQKCIQWSNDVSCQNLVCFIVPWEVLSLISRIWHDQIWPSCTPNGGATFTQPSPNSWHKDTRGVSPCRAGLPALEVCLGNSVSSSLVLHLLLAMIREYEWIW